MIAVARAKLAAASIGNAQVRLGDIANLDPAIGRADLIILHQVLHYFDDPGRLLGEVRKVLRPGGELLIVDFAPHELEFLRTHHAHRRLGLSDTQMQAWARANHLTVEAVEVFPNTDGTRGADGLPLASRRRGRAREERCMNRHPSEAHRASRLVSTERAPLQLSFEFFPPKTDVMEERFWDSIGKLAPLKPRFVSVTYGAGGSTRERTLRMVSRVKADTGVDAAAHLTCVGATRAEVDEVVSGYRDAGISRIVALRGDPAEGIGKPFTRIPRATGTPPISSPASGSSGISTSRSPPIPRSIRRAPTGAATSTISSARSMPVRTARSPRCSSTTTTTSRFVDRAEAAGITAPIVPGIQPIHSFKQISGFAAKCGAKIPGLAGRALRRAWRTIPRPMRSSPPPSRPSRCSSSSTQGVTEFHFYTLNRSNLVLALARLLGVRPD